MSYRRRVTIFCVGAISCLVATTAHAMEETGPINTALARTEETATSSNMLQRIDDDPQIRIDLGRRQRAERDFEQSKLTLSAILESNAAEQFKHTALLELALTAQQAGEPVRAVQIFAQYADRYPDDANVPDILLRQGLLYRQMGAKAMALSKFYAVMTTVLNRKLDGSGYYQRLVLQAQTEIADTYYLQGDYGQAAEFFERLLKLDTTVLNKPEIHLKLIRSLSLAARYDNVVTQARDLLQSTPDDAEARFLLGDALQRLGHKEESVREVLHLLESNGASTWKCRAGNQIANELYNSADYTNALVVYRALSMVDKAPEWQIPVLYQIGLIQERLHQPGEAFTTYAGALDYGVKLGDKAEPNLKTVLDMTAWRKNHLAWQTQAQEAVETLRPASPSSSMH
jgi:tetratricopeptide (TPR) repeat protein